jgi:peroxiredoxin
VKRNIVVPVLVLAALILMGWAGISNYQHRKQQQEQMQKMQAVLVPNAPTQSDVASEMDSYKSPLIGKPAPDFTLEDLSGKKVSLSSYKGKAVVLDFWATWCAPCKVEIPWFIKLHEQYAAQGLEILGVSADDLDKDDKAKLAQDKADIAKFAGGMHINYPVLIDADSIAKPYGGLDALPTTFFIDRNGKVVASTLGLAGRDEIEANIKKALGS